MRLSSHHFDRGRNRTHCRHCTRTCVVTYTSTSAMHFNFGVYPGWHSTSIEVVTPFLDHGFLVYYYYCLLLLYLSLCPSNSCMAGRQQPTLQAACSQKVSQLEPCHQRGVASRTCNVDTVSTLPHWSCTTDDTSNDN